MDLKQAIKLLQLEKFNGVDDLKKKFRQLAHQYHPDKNPGAATVIQFRKILEAYRFSLQHITDLFGHFGLQESSQDAETARTAIKNLDDIFEDIFGFSKSGRVLGYHEPQVVSLTLEEFALGAKKRQRMIAWVKCPECRGNGALPGTSVKICSYCFGQGKISVPSSGTPKGPICPKCRGRGRDMPSPCERCDGYGRLRRTHRQEFEIPAGLREGQIYTLQSRDLDSRTTNDIFVEVRIPRLPIFQIDHCDLLCQYQCDMNKERGAQVWVKTPFGPVQFPIPKNIREGENIRVKGAGLYVDTRRQERGDLVVSVVKKEPGFFKKILGGLFAKA